MTKPAELIAKSLRLYAERLCEDPDSVSKSEARTLDRALRSCESISDIDVVWVHWRYVGEPRGWLTVDELIYSKGRVGYP